MSHKKAAFTLMELLLVVAIISILAALLLPSLARGKNNARKIHCLNNLKQMVTGSLMYADDNSSGSPTADTLGFPGERWRGDDDVNYLHQGYVTTLKTFICPSTDDKIDMTPVDPELTEGDSASLWLESLRVCAAATEDRRGTSYETSGVFAFTVRKSQKTMYPAHIREAAPIGVAMGPSQVWLHFDQDIDVDRLYDSLNEKNNHGASGANVSFSDGHVHWVRKSDYRNSYDMSEDLCVNRWYHGP